MREPGWYPIDGLALWRYWNGRYWDDTMTAIEYALKRPIGPKIEEPMDQGIENIVDILRDENSSWEQFAIALIDRFPDDVSEIVYQIVEKRPDCGKWLPIDE